MSITKVLSDKEITDSAKLERVAEIVASARENYGNSDETIDEAMINTTHGSMGFTFLEDEAKVTLLRNEVCKLKAQAVEYAGNCPGVNLNKKIEELLAINPFFANVATGVKFEYI